jgi:GTPase SAR1 family protein
VYDVTNADSFQNINMWLDYVKENRGEDVNVVIVGNKIDQAGERAVSASDAREKLKYVGSRYFEVSAKTGENLETLFTETCAELLNGNVFETTVSNIELPKKKPV